MRMTPTFDRLQNSLFGMFLEGAKCHKNDPCMWSAWASGREVRKRLSAFHTTNLFWLGVQIMSLRCQKFLDTSTHILNLILWMPYFPKCRHSGKCSFKNFKSHCSVYCNCSTVQSFDAICFGVDKWKWLAGIQLKLQLASWKLFFSRNQIAQTSGFPSLLAAHQKHLFLRASFYSDFKS